ncbi:hypothetical protein [Radiobacillus kanasensis]|nr:hypothetical protein [Radiobacillus kanasensis]
MIGKDIELIVEEEETLTYRISWITDGKHHGQWMTLRKDGELE